MTKKKWEKDREGKARIKEDYKEFIFGYSLPFFFTKIYLV